MPRQRAFFSIEAPAPRDSKDFDAANSNDLALWGIAILASWLATLYSVFHFNQNLLLPAAHGLSALSGAEWAVAAAGVALAPAAFNSVVSVLLHCSLAQGLVVDRFLESFVLNWSFSVGNLLALPALERLIPGDPVVPTASLFITALLQGFLPFLTTTASEKKPPAPLAAVRAASPYGLGLAVGYCIYSTATWALS